MLAYRRLGYINNKNLDKLLKILISLKLNKNSPEPRFYKPYTKGKQYKTYNKKPPSHQIKKPDKRWHINLVGGGQSFILIKGAKYGI